MCQTIITTTTFLCGCSFPTMITVPCEWMQNHEEHSTIEILTHENHLQEASVFAPHSVCPDCEHKEETPAEPQ